MERICKLCFPINKVYLANGVSINSNSGVLINVSKRRHLATSLRKEKVFVRV